MAMGAAAILLWGLSAAGIVGVGKRMGVWQLLAVTPALAGLFQIVCYRALGRSLRSILLPPIGFLITSALAAGICLWRREWEPMGVRTWCGVIGTAIGPWAGGYLLWELALHRVPGTTLGLFGSVAPVLSTVCLMGLYALTGGVQAGGAHLAALFTASVLIAAAVALGAVNTEEHRSEKESA